MFPLWIQLRPRRIVGGLSIHLDIVAARLARRCPDISGGKASADRPCAGQRESAAAALIDARIAEVLRNCQRIEKATARVCRRATARHRLAVTAAIV